MGVLISRDALDDFEKKLLDQHRYHLWHKGYHKTINGAITAREVEELEVKYGLQPIISDFDFGKLEGNIFFTIMLRTFYDHYFDEGHIAWVKKLASLYTNRIWCFICKCAINKPQISKSQTFDYSKQLECKLRDADAILEEYQDEDSNRSEVNNWYLTHSELGYLCGFVSAAHWAIGEEWVFNEEDFDAPIDWERLYDYLNKRASKLKQRKIQEVSVVSQLVLKIKAGGKSDGKNGIPVRNIRCKLPSEPVDTSPTLPKPSSWLDW